MKQKYIEAVVLDVQDKLDQMFCTIMPEDTIELKDSIVEKHITAMMKEVEESTLK